MSAGERVELPAATRARLEAWVQQREALSAVIEATVQACREALNVPQEYVIRDVTQGFTAPPEKTQAGQGE